jgi:hypothetical protein
MGLSDSRQGPAASYLFPASVYCPCGSPRFLRRSFHARCPLPPRRARRLLLPVASPSVPGFIILWQTGHSHFCVTRPLKGSLALRLACSPCKASPVELLLPALAQLLVKRAIYKISSFQNIRSARLILALQRRKGRKKNIQSERGVLGALAEGISEPEMFHA